MGTPRTREPDPDLGHGAVDKDRYLSRDVAAAELDRVFRRSWLYAVPAGDVRAPGRWAVFDLGPESILIVRTEDGALAAHHNVCQHRGRRLMEDERGRAAAFRCGYHAWTYRLDGEPLMPVAGDVNVQIDCYDRHSRFLLPSGVPAPAYRNRDRPTVAQIAAFARYDFDATGFEGTADEVLVPFQRHKLAWLRDRGYPVDDLDLEQVSENYHYTVFPNTQISFYPERTLITRSRPHPSGDPGRMVFDLQSFVQVPAGTEVPSRPATEHGAGPGFPLEPDFVRQDAANVVRIQQGLRSSGYAGAQLGALELRIRHWHAVYERAMGLDGEGAGGHDATGGDPP